MFFGSFNQKDDAILISDVQADAFKALLEYIYTDKINIKNVDQAFDLCYAAKKYMLPYVVDQCTTYLWSDLCPKNACRAYEFAKLFEEPSLQEKCLQIICTKTMDVIVDPSFEEIELSTLITILDQDALTIDNELSLFSALNRYAEKHVNDANTSGNENADQNQNEEDAIDVTEPMNLDAAEAGPSNRPDNAAPPAQQQQQIQRSPGIQEAIKKIRFLTLNPQEFADGPARTNLLSQSEAFVILMNISTPNSVYPMPEGFTLNKNPRNYNFIESRSPSPLPLPISIHPPRVSVDSPIHQLRAASPDDIFPSHVFNILPRELRNHEERRFHCGRAINQMRQLCNRSVMECSFTFSVDRNVSIIGITFFTQTRSSAVNSDRYNEIIYTYLMDSHGSRLTYAHSNQRVNFDSDHEILFDRPICILSNKVYKIGAVFNKPGIYNEFSVHNSFRTNQLTVTFNTGATSDTQREGLIRGLIFSM